MRRSDKQINDSKTIENVLEEAEFCRIALVDGNEPYIVPMNFGYKDNSLYLHSATEGRKIDILEENNSICFQTDIKTAIVTSENPCNWGMKYLSVVGHGKAHLIDSLAEKRGALDIIMSKYSNGSSFEYSDEVFSKVAVIKVEIEEILARNQDIKE